MQVTTDIPMEKFLTPTRLIDSDHPEIMAQATQLTRDGQSQSKKAAKIFYFVRDEIRYEFKAKPFEFQYHASFILKDRKGFCTQKAILFCALARACGIPAGVYFFDIIDHALPKRMVALMRTNYLYRHGITALWLNGVWRLYDATLQIDLVRQQQFVPVEFDPDRDCLFQPHTLTGAPHIAYVKDHGLQADVDHAEIIEWLSSAYPHLTAKYHSQNSKTGTE